MMARGVVKIEGFKEARETLQELSRTVQRNVGRSSLLVPAAIIADAVRRNAPVSSDPSDKTRGSLKASVKVVPHKNERGAPRVAVEADDVAAVPNEFGTTRQPARPFFRPAVDGALGRALAAFAAELRNKVGAAAKRAASKGRRR